MGPVLIIDTPGFDDEGQLGQLRVRKTRQVLNKTDVAVLVVDAAVGMTDLDRELLALIKEKNIPHLLVYNKSDLVAEEKSEDGAIFVSAATGKNIHELKERIAALGKSAEEEKRIVGDLIGENDLIVLVTPIDEAAPKGRIILPQQQTIRDILDSNAMCVVTKETQLTETLQSLGKKPRMVITDSQVFGKVSADTPADIPLTSFSILMARYKGFLESAVKGVAAIETLQEGDTILIAEGCTHHRQCNDIGSVKIPRWLRNHVGQNVNIELSSGADFPEDLSRYKVIIHCGGCMLPAREVMYRLKCAEDQGVPMTNYGIAIAYMQGILRRSVDIFPDLAKILDEIK